MANKKNQRKKIKSLRKNKNPQQIQVNLKANNDSTETLNNSNSEETQERKCLICARKINANIGVEVDPFDEVFTFQILCQLFKILKISPAVCTFLLADSLSTVKVQFCESCDKTITHCLKVSQEIDSLRNVLEESTIKIKEDIIEGYYCRPDTDLSQRTNSNIRKTLVQCWTTCQVKIKKLPSSSFESHPNVKTIKGSKPALWSVKKEICDDNEVDFTEGTIPPSPNEIVEPQTQKVVETEGIASDNDFDDEDIEPPCSPIPATLSDESDTENIDDPRKEDAVSEAPCSPSPSPLLGTDQSDAEKIGDPSTKDTVPDVENEEECDLTFRRTLRPRRKNKILTDTPIEIESDENASETDSVYSPDPPFNDEEQEIYEVNTKKKRHFRSLPTAFKSPKRRAKVESKAKPSLKKTKTRQSSANIQNTVATKSTSVNAKSEEFFCINCNKGFIERKELQVHKRQHYDVSRFPCDICNKASFFLLRSLKKHTRIKHSGTIIPFEKKKQALESFFCTYCDKHYERKDFKVTPDTETETEGDQLSIHCDLPNCEKTFSNFFRFSIHHSRTCVEKARLIAENPENSRKKLGYVRIYSDSKTTNETTETETKDATTAAKTTLLRCKICGMSFKQKKSLYLHEMRHAGQRITCPECPENFKSIFSVRLHQIRVHGKPTKSTYDPGNELDSFECVRCKKIFLRSSYLVPGPEAEAEPENSDAKDSGDTTSPPNKILRIEVSKWTGSSSRKTLLDFKEFQWHHRRHCSWRPRIQVGSGYVESTSIGVLQGNKTTKTQFAYRCSICGKGYRTLSRYNAHLAFHRKEFNYPCNTCEDKFVSLELLNRHIASAHKFKSTDDKNAYKNSYHCTPCEKRIPFNLVVTKSGETKALCVFDNCSGSSFNLKAHEAHHRQHHSDQKSSYFCRLCNRIYLAEEFRELGSSVDPKIRCSFASCNKSVEHFKSWSHHHAYHHKIDKGLAPNQHHSKLANVRVTCKFCPMEFANKYNCEAHITTAHTKNFKFYCEICGLGRPTMDKLRTHMASHSEARPFACELCPSTFKMKNHLKYHMNKHNGVLPFVCEICGKAYHSSNNLNMHRKSHKR